MSDSAAIAHERLGLLFANSLCRRRSGRGVTKFCVTAIQPPDSKGERLHLADPSMSHQSGAPMSPLGPDAANRERQP
jgi:hypothetical protein